MDSSRPIPRPHLAVTLPEILHEIASFLPTYDLHKHVTLVSRGWEDAARKQLLARVLVDLTPKNMAGYLELAKIRGNHHKRVCLSYLNFENLSPEESKLLENFTFTGTPPITELRLDYFPHEWSIHPSVLTLFSHCPRLQFVSFSPKAFTLPTIKSPLPKDISFLKVVAFGISLPANNSKFSGLSLTNFLRLVSVFPNLKILQGRTLPHNVLEYFLSNTGSIREVSVWLNNTDGPFSIQKPSLFLTRIELQVGTLSNMRNCNVLMATFAGQVEKLKLTAECNLPWEEFNWQQCFLTINKLPRVLSKLKWLEIGVPRCSNNKGNVKKVPALGLMFPENLVYSRQFPALEKFVVSDRCGMRYMSHEEIEEEEWFEICAGFLDKYFLRGECLMVRDVRIPLPPGERVGFGLFQKLGGDENKVNSELVDCSDFFQRIATTFPNLGWEMFDGVGDSERVE
ncbi:uncharacterized protein LOC118436671 [Folsomia candida]|nr:uncharacterized protein LOC118436671 [Folsomia candida]